MRLQKNKTLYTIALILMLATSAAIMGLPNVAAKTTITLSPLFYNFIGVNSPTLISWAPQPPASDPLLYHPVYANKTSVWPNATVTFTRPDGTKDVRPGPFDARTELMQGRASRVDVILIYTPNMAGNWVVSFYWPGDDTYNAVNQTSTFTVGAAPIPKREVMAYLSLKPYPAVGLRQPFLINAWVQPPPMSQRDFFEDYMFTFTSPSGSKKTVGPMDSESPGTVWFDYQLDEIGTWSIKFDFPGDVSNLPATVTRTITVQQAWVSEGYPEPALPTDPWTFPINVQNREWRTIAGPWYQSYYNASEGSWNPYTEAPKTAHVLWALPSSGQVGGFIGSPNSIETGAGEAVYGAGGVGIYTSNVPNIRTVMAGRGYYTEGSNIICVDMQTGEPLWKVPGSFNVGAERGRTAALYSFSSTRFIAYDAITGAVLLNVTGNSMLFFDNPYVYTSTSGRLIKWTTTGDSTDFASRILWNVTNPFGTPPGAQDSFQ